MRLMKRADISRSSVDFSMYLAQNWPRLWSHQIHIVLIGCGVGIVLSLAVWGLLLDSTVESMKGILLLFVAAVQTLILMGWFLRVITRLKPKNLVEYNNSPLILTTVLYSFAIMLGPLLLTILYFDALSDVSSFTAAVIFGELALMLLLFRFMSVSRPDRETGGGAVSYGALFLLAAVLVGLLITWLGGGIFALVIALGCGVIVTMSRLLHSIYASRRSGIDGACGLLNVFVPAAAATTGFILLFDSSNSIISEQKRNIFVQNKLLLLLMDNGWTWLVAVGVLIFTVVWVDLLAWVLARVFFLPKR